MVHEKQMDEEGYENIVKDLTTSAEMLRTQQNEKQTVIDAFGKERERFQKGIISQMALKASVPQVQKRLNDLDEAIRESIEKVRLISSRISKFASAQAPKHFHVDIGGVEGQHHEAKPKHHKHHHKHHSKHKKHKHKHK